MYAMVVSELLTNEYCFTGLALLEGRTRREEMRLAREREELRELGVEVKKWIMEFEMNYEQNQREGRCWRSFPKLSLAHQVKLGFYTRKLNRLEFLDYIRGEMQVSDFRWKRSFNINLRTLLEGLKELGLFHIIKQDNMIQPVIRLAVNGYITPYFVSLMAGKFSTFPIFCFETDNLVVRECSLHLLRYISASVDSLVSDRYAQRKISERYNRRVLLDRAEDADYN